MKLNHTVAPAAASRCSRRRFLKGAAAAATFSIVPRHVLGGAGQIAPSQKISLAAIGTGGQGLQNVQAFLEFPEVQIVAVCDVNRESAGYISWNWDRGKASNVAGREPARRFVDACRGGPAPGANLVDHAGLLSEVCVLGNVALRSGKKLAWDGPNFKITNDAAANRLLHRDYRAGWSL